MNLLIPKQELNNLLNSSNKYCISIYMPTVQAGKETRQNPIRFKNLVSEAEKQLTDVGYSPSEIKGILGNAEKLIDDYDFWQHQDSGLAYFVSEDQIFCYKLPQDFPEVVVVSDRFHLKPLLPLITTDSSFYLLALAQNQIRLFLGSRYAIEEITLPEDVPASLAEALRFDDKEKQIQFHSNESNGNVLYHGQGVGTTDNKDEILRFFQKIDRGLTPFLQTEKAPLILAGVEYLLPIYQEANSYNHLLEEGVIGNPEHLSAEELHQKALPIIQPYFDQAKQQECDRYRELVATESMKQVSADIEKIIPTTYQGQVDTLLVAEDAEYWGKYEPDDNFLEIDDNSTPENISLLDFVALQTVSQGGKFYLIPNEEMPNGNSIAAIFRYPVYANSPSKV